MRTAALFCFGAILGVAIGGHSGANERRSVAPTEKALRQEVQTLTVAIHKDEASAASIRAQIKHVHDSATKKEAQARLGKIKRRLLRRAAELKKDKAQLKALLASSKPAAAPPRTTSKSIATSTPEATVTRSTTRSISKPTQTGKKTSSKKGLGYNNPAFTTAFGTSLAFVYNWADKPGGALVKNVEYVPMLWGSGTNGFAAAAKAAIGTGSLHILGSNEPDLAAQSNLTPAQAVAIWKANMEPLRKNGVKLVSPAITNGGPPLGVAWMAEFLAKCTGCHVDFIAAHWYDSATNDAYFRNYFTDMFTQFKKPIWITEFAGSGTVAQQQSFFKTIIPWMEKQDFIARYAAFGDFAGTFVDGTGALTSLGQTYKDTV